MELQLPTLGGVHHVTAITSSAKDIYEFFTYILGMRLVKKNVNQDDIQTYHLFFADDRGNAGTDMTFFDFKGIAQNTRGTNEISRTGFRVPNRRALDYWLLRFEKYKVKHDSIQTLFGREMIFFEDFDGQRYALIADNENEGITAGEPWHKGPVPDEFAITGLGMMFINVSHVEVMKEALENIFQMREVERVEKYHLFEMGAGGNGGSVILVDDTQSIQSMQGYGGVHHLAFRVKNREELDSWISWFNTHRLANSGYVDRFYFESLYVRVYPNILFELATDGPGFIDDQEAYEVLGEKITLPPKYRNQREYIESQLKDFDTVRSTKEFPIEYLGMESSI